MYLLYHEIGFAMILASEMTDNNFAPSFASETSNPALLPRRDERVSAHEQIEVAVDSKHESARLKRRFHCRRFITVPNETFQ